MPAPSTTTFCALNGSMPSGASAVAVDLLQVEEERLDHVLGDLAGEQVDEVAALDLDRGVEVDLGTLDGRGHDVVRRRVVGALQLLAQVRREGRQVLRELRVRRRAAGDLVALDVPRLRRGLLLGGPLLDPRLGGRDELLAAWRRPRRGCPSRAPAPGAAAGPASAASSARRRCRACAPCARRRRRPAAGPSCTSGKPICTLRVVDRDAVVGGQADLQAAAERGAVDRRADGHAERLQAAQLRLARAHHLGQLRARRPSSPS